MSVKALAAKYKDEMIALRRWFHQHPELSLKEYNTSNASKKNWINWIFRMKPSEKPACWVRSKAEKKEKPFCSVPTWTRWK